MIYVYEHPETGEREEVSQGMNDEHTYVKDGIKWNRVFLVPNASIDTKLDPFSSKDFAAKTSGKKGTVGDLLDRSREMAERRKDKDGGVDRLAEKEAKEYNKKTGLKHPSQIKKLD